MPCDEEASYAKLTHGVIVTYVMIAETKLHNFVRNRS